MSTNFPTSLDSLTNPLSTDTMVAVSHSSQHSNVNDAIEALEAKIGVNSSAVTTSHDYKLSGVTSTDKAESTGKKDATDGYAGLTLFKINFKNVANTFTSFFTNSNTASRTYTFKDADGTIAFTSDITGTNSGTNTGDETAARIATINHGTSAKTLLVDADEITGQDSADSFGLIRTTWTNVKAFLKTYNDTLYAALAGSVSQVFSASSIELGHASDTTISRLSPGKIAVEGVTILDTTNISDTVYGSGWNGDTTNAPSKNAVYDEMELHVGGNAAKNIGYLNIPINSQSAAYTTVITDAGKCIQHPSSDATPRTFTIDSNANVAYPVGTAITFSNRSAGAVTIAITSDTLYWDGTGATGSRTLAQYGKATALKETTTTWSISGINLT